MADFCTQCSIEHFGEDTEDFKGLVSAEESKKGLFANVLCEGCGPTIVDHNGVCQGGCLNPAHGQQED